MYVLLGSILKEDFQNPRGQGQWALSQLKPLPFTSAMCKVKLWIHDPLDVSNVPKKKKKTIIHVLRQK